MDGVGTLIRIMLSIGQSRVRLIGIGVSLPCWLLLWTQQSYWNPLYFVGLWVGATLIFYSIGPTGYPGIRRHAYLALVSVSAWWWFELVNSYVHNWEYITIYDYGFWPYTILASIAFSTVVPALDSICRFTLKMLEDVSRVSHCDYKLCLVEILAGAISVFLVFAMPTIFFPLVWVGPFFVFDGIAGLKREQNILTELVYRRWGVPLAIGSAGLICGMLWEFWNFWAMPRWIYSLPYLDFADVFEMPILGYLGYIPFVRSIYQLVKVLSPAKSDVVH